MTKRLLTTFGIFLFTSVFVLPVTGQEEGEISPAAEEESLLSAPEDVDFSPESVPVSPPSGLEAFGISPADLAEAREAILAAEHGLLNRKLSVSMDAGFRYSYYGMSTSEPVYKSGSLTSPVRGTYDEGLIDLKLKFGYLLRGGSMSAEMNYKAQPDNRGRFDLSMNIGYPSFSSALGPLAYRITTGIGDLKYIVANSPVDRPLLAGRFSSFDDAYTYSLIFNRVPWQVVEPPENIYRSQYDGYAEIPSDPVQDSFRKSGIGVQFQAPGDFNVALTAVKYSFHPLIGVTRNIGKAVVGAGYFLSTDDPDWSGDPVYQAHTGNASLLYNASKFFLFLEGSYTTSLIREFHITNAEYNSRDKYELSSVERSGLRETQEDGYAVHATLTTRKSKFLMFNANQFFLRYVLASDGFDPTENDLRDVNYKYDSIIRPVDVLRNVDDIYSGAQSLFIGDRFNFLKGGKMRLTAGLAKSTLATPDAYRLTTLFHNKIMHFTGPIYASDWLGKETQLTDRRYRTDYKSLWQQDWNDIYEGSSRMVWSHSVYRLGINGSTNLRYRVPLVSEKNYSMFAADYGVDISRLIRLPFPVYYQARIQYSAIFVNGGFGMPFSDVFAENDDGEMENPDMTVRYFLSGHYFVLAVKKNFHLLGYCGLEQNQHRFVRGEERIPDYSPNPGETVVKTKLYDSSVNVNDAVFGAGGGFEWYFQDGFGFYFRFHTAEVDNRIQDFKTRHYGLRFELRRFFSYT